MNHQWGAYVEKEESQYPLMCHYVQHIACLRIDNRQSMDSVGDERVYGFKERRIRADAPEFLVLLV